jgi:hypothetical protein
MLIPLDTETKKRRDYPFLFRKAMASRAKNTPKENVKE